MVLLTVIAPNSLISQYLAYCFNTAWGEGGAKHHSSLSKQNIRWVVIKLLGSMCSPTAFWKASGIDITLVKWKKKNRISQQQSNIYGQLGPHRKYTIVMYGFLERSYLLIVPTKSLFLCLANQHPAWRIHQYVVVLYQLLPSPVN